MKYWGLIVLLLMAAGYVALGIYGKYRRIKEAYDREARGGPSPPGE